MVQKKLKKPLNIYLKFFYRKSLLLKIDDNYAIDRQNKKQLKHDTIFEKYCSLKFINILIQKGKKSIAEKIFFNFLMSLKIFIIKNLKNKKLKFKNTFLLFVAILKYLKVPFNVKNIRIGGRVYLIPFLVKVKQQQTVAIKFLLKNFLLKSKNKNKFLFKDIKDVINLFLLQSSLNKNLNDYYKIAYDNRAFAHYRWF